MNILIENITALLPDETKVCSVYVQGGVIAGIDCAPAGFTAEKRINGSGML
ncbi:MAG: dihydroorotase, partial [Ruminococcaceae bacterium]|nr:dihydroorotase [Oscillospiraceae bacterium]